MPTEKEFQCLAISRNHGGPGGGGDLTAQNIAASCVASDDPAADKFTLKPELEKLGVWWINKEAVVRSNAFSEILRKERADAKAASDKKLPAVTISAEKLATVAELPFPAAEDSPPRPAPKKRQRSPPKGKNKQQQQQQPVFQYPCFGPPQITGSDDMLVDSTPAADDVPLPTPQIVGKKRKSPSPKHDSNEVKAVGRATQEASPPAPKKPRKPRAKKQKVPSPTPEDEFEAETTESVIDFNEVVGQLMSGAGFNGI